MLLRVRKIYSFISFAYECNCSNSSFIIAGGKEWTVYLTTGVIPINKITALCRTTSSSLEILLYQEEEAMGRRASHLPSAIQVGGIDGTSLSPVPCALCQAVSCKKFLPWMWENMEISICVSRKSFQEEKIAVMMVKLMCQFSWPTVPRYLVEHYSGCFLGVLWMRLMFISVDFESSRLPSIMWVGLIQSAESLKKKNNLLRKREFSQLTAFGFEL